MADVPEVIGSELWCADKARLVLISGGKRREVIARLLSSHSSTLAYVRFRPKADISSLPPAAGRPCYGLVTVTFK